MRKRKTPYVVRRPGDAEWVPNGLLDRLVGNRLYSVEFVMDYVQLRFDGDEIASGPVVLHCYVWPKVKFGDRFWRETDQGYADALRGLISGTVNATAEGTGVGLRVDLDTGSIVIHPELEEVYVEIAELQGFDDGSWMVWRPGETSFEDLV